MGARARARPISTSCSRAGGYSFDSGDKVVLDMKYMAGSGPRAVPTVIQLDGDAMNRDDVVTSRSVRC